MSVLSDSDRRVVTNAIVRARAPRIRMTRTQALAPYPQRKRVEKPKPLLFIGLCSYCGEPADLGSVACHDHRDLPVLDVLSSRNSTGTRRKPSRASAADATGGDCTCST